MTKNIYKNIYKYKIRYTNFLKTGGSSFVNENTSENNQAANSLENQNNQNNLEATQNFQNLEISEPENVSNLTLRFKNRNEWPERALDWSTQSDYTYLNNFVWDENGVGKTVSGDQIRFDNSRFALPYYYIIINNRYSFKTDAFVDEDQNKLTNFLQNNGIENNEIAREIMDSENFVWPENGIKFKDRNEWPENALKWSSQSNYTYLNDVVWDQNGVGKTVSGDQIRFNNNTLGFQNYILVNNRFTFKTDAFTEESQNTLRNFLISNGITI